jgi:hypothetical protein
MAEIELSALVRQCLDRRLPDLATLAQEVQAWQKQRNDDVIKVQWQFKTNDARTKLQHLYPKISGAIHHSAILSDINISLSSDAFFLLKQHLHIIFR